MVEDIFNLGIIQRYASIFSSGILFLLLGLYFLDLNSLHIDKFSIIANNPSIYFFVFVILTFLIGGYLYLFSLRFYSCLFTTLHICIGKGDEAWNYWRHFFASISFSLISSIFVFLIFLPIFSLLFSISNSSSLLILSVIITFVGTVLLYLDKVIPCNDKEKFTEKSFGHGFEEGLYTEKGLMEIVKYQKEYIKNLKSSKSPK